MTSMTRAAPASRQGWLSGLTWRGVALIALLALLNALRRNVTEFFDLPLWTWLRNVGESIVTGLIAMLLVTVVVVAIYNRVSAAPRWRYPALALGIVIASLVGTAILGAIESNGTFEFSEIESIYWWFEATWPRYLLLGALLAAVFVYFRGAEDSEAARHQAEVDRARLAQQMDEARLLMLQAQIEPHFLFNTLATVRRLYQTDAAAAESMLDNLMRYLAVALPQMRASDSTLGREAALAEAYLGIQQIRMGRRLRFAIEVPFELRDAPLPPMMLLTLAENAVKHGLNPLPEGGFIRISARVDGGQLRLEVADSGRGFVKDAGGGTGLSNIRARLFGIYGQAARLRIGANKPRGVTATIFLPYAIATTSAAAA
ncbi:MAG TPA: histidine kinase [Casimicrobiaceae bacterium]|nr:histidine kinase [Casimicrobiaceae bacterium]